MDRMLSVLITVFLFLFANSALAADCEKLIVTGHPSYPPVAWKEGNRIVGASVKMVEMIAQDLGLKVESKFMGSWGDAQEAIRKGTADIQRFLFTVNIIDASGWRYSAYITKASIISFTSSL